MSFAGKTAFPKNHLFRRIQFLGIHELFYAFRHRIHRVLPTIETRMPTGPHQPSDATIPPIIETVLTIKHRYTLSPVALLFCDPDQECGHRPVLLKDIRQHLLDRIPPHHPGNLRPIFLFRSLAEILEENVIPFFRRIQ